MCQQRICTPADLDLAVTLGLGYPHGPLAMGDRSAPTNMLEVLFNMQTVLRRPALPPEPVAAPPRRTRPFASPTKRK